jgi:hypothetical protein
MIIRILSVVCDIIAGSIWKSSRLPRSDPSSTQGPHAPHIAAHGQSEGGQKTRKCGDHVLPGHSLGANFLQHLSQDIDETAMHIAALIHVGRRATIRGEVSSRYVTFQMAEVAVSRLMFADILLLITRLRAPPAPA